MLLVVVKFRVLTVSRDAFLTTAVVFDFHSNLLDLIVAVEIVPGGWNPLEKVFHAQNERADCKCLRITK